MTKARVYVAGPYSLGQPDENIRAATDAAEKLWHAGFIPFVPHWNFFWGFLYPKDHKEWLCWCKAWLRECDFLLRLPGESAGADAEVEFAERLGLRVFGSIEELKDYWRGKRGSF